MNFDSIILQVVYLFIIIIFSNSIIMPRDNFYENVFPLFTLNLSLLKHMPALELLSLT